MGENTFLYRLECKWRAFVCFCAHQRHRFKTFNGWTLCQICDSDLIAHLANLDEVLAPGRHE